MDDDIDDIGIPSNEWGVTADRIAWSSKEALDMFDAIWYTRTSQSARWMDIIGDYAGEELFLINGDSLLSVVLDDPLLALGKQNGTMALLFRDAWAALISIIDLSFQYLHARYSLERVFKEYKLRNAVFEVVCWFP